MKEASFTDALPNMSHAVPPHEGVFWVIAGKLHAFPFSSEYPDGVAKSGTTYQHERLWELVRPRGCNVSFSYWPRGRVVFAGRGKPVVYMSPHIPRSLLPEIQTAFGLREPSVIRYDFSRHYRCCFDN